MSFQYRFASILQLRRQQRDEAGVAVGQAIEAIQRIDQQRNEIREQRQQLQQTSAHGRVGSLSVDALLAEGRYDLQLQAEVLSLDQTMEQLSEELQRRQQALAIAQAEVKKFERLEQKELEEFHVRQARRQQAEMDEAAARRYARLHSRR